MVYFLSLNLMIRTQIQNLFDFFQISQSNSICVDNYDKVLIYSFLPLMAFFTTNLSRDICFLYISIIINDIFIGCSAVGDTLKILSNPVV